ncbi:hypothetical protein ACF068_03120 [Streptomyces sp. NPDC016309]|uniref:hypothetical protein n=1 Tax=Streptomyces sp. NPDC016309 TaxID=3364965 RepID=UPI0036FBB4AF
MSQSAQELIARAGERGLAAAALACLDRCLPLLGPAPDDLLRPLWCSVAEGGAGWTGRLEEVRAAVAADAGGDAAAPVRAMLAAAPAAWDAAALRVWAGSCSGAALELHRRLGGGPLLDAEERRQVQVLELLADAPADGRPVGLRPVLDAAAEGRRVLRAVVSRRERGA